MSATEEWLKSLRETNAAKLGAALSYDKQKPDQAAEADQVGRALGVPSSVVSSQPDVFKRQFEQKKYSDILKDAPKTAAWLKDRQNGALAKDDLDNLTWFEKQMQPFARMGGPEGGLGVFTGVGRAPFRFIRRMEAVPFETGARIDAQTVGDFGKTQEEIYQSIVRDWENVSPETLSMARQTAQARFETVQGLTDDERTEILTRGADDLAKARELVDKAASVPMSGGATKFRDTTLAYAENTVMGALRAFTTDPVGGAAFVAETAAEFLPALVTATGVTLVTKSPTAGALTMGLGSGLMENTTSAMDFLADQKVDLSTPEAAIAVLENTELMQAAADRGLTRGLIIGLMDAISGGVAGQTLMESPAGDMVAQGLAQVFFGAGGEGLAQAASGQEIDWRDIVVEGLAELVTLPVEVLGVGGRGTLKELARGVNASALPDQLDKLDQVAAASKLKQRSPDKFYEAMEAQELGEVYVPADKLREFFQAKDMTGEEWGFALDYLEEQAMAGEHVPLSLATYASKITGTDAAQWVRDNAVFDPDERSAVEAAEFNDQVQDVLRQAREEASAAIEEDRAMRAADIQIYDQVFSELRAAGRSPDAANYEARVHAAFWRTMGERYGEDPLDLARSMGLRIVGPQTPEQARRRGDLDVRLNELRANPERALKPRGDDLAKFVIGEGGIQDEGGDVASLDPPKGVVAETYDEIIARRSEPTLGGMPAEGKGIGLDEMARRAHEAGYIQGEDTNTLLEALRASVAGEPVYRQGEGVDPDTLALSEALSSRGIDLAEMSNDEVAAALEAADDGREFEQAAPEGSDAFRAWVGADVDVIEGEDIANTDFSGPGPYVMKVYHGTTHEFEEFNAGIKGTKEGHFGAVNYFTSNRGDAAQNYLSGGPDILGRIENMAERLEHEVEAAIEDAGGDPDDVAMWVNDNYEIDMQALDLPRVDNELDGEIDPIALAQEIANRYLRGGGEKVLEVYVRTEKPFVVDAAGGPTPFIEFRDYAALEQQALERVAEDEGIEVSEVEENRDDYEDQIDEARWDIESEQPSALFEAVERVAAQYDQDAQELFGAVSELDLEGASHAEFAQAMRNAEPFVYAEDAENGGMVGSHLIAEVIRELGFDSIILKNAEDQFSGMNIEAATSHVHVFDQFNSNIKSVENRGTFDRSDPRIMFQSAPAADSQAFRDWFGDSKVVDENGEPLVVYHGTNADFDAFDIGKAGSAYGMEGEDGFFFTSLESEAQKWADKAPSGQSPRVLPVYLSMQMPLAYEAPPSMSPVAYFESGTGPFDRGPAAFIEYARNNGYDGKYYDGIIVTGEGETLYVAFSPTQIKSVNNRGTFDPNDARILYQPAYHGSPHIFDAFSTSHMGTGEGAQAFGWGMYFAGRKGVADGYRRALAHKSRGISVNGENKIYAAASPKDASPEEIATLWASQSLSDGNSFSSAQMKARNAVLSAERGDLTSFQKEGGWGDVEKLRKARDILGEWADKEVRALPAGRLYKVDIPEDSELLAWDAPLSEQSEGVQDKIRPLLDKFTPEDDALLSELGVEVDGDPTGVDPIMGMTGQQFYEDLQRRFKAQAYTDGAALTREMAASGEGWTAENLAKNAEIEERYNAPDKAASLALNAAGILGHRFLDQGSRSDGEGTYNYVIYNDEAVKVLEFEQNQEGKRGSITLPSGGLQSGETVINLFESANLSTFLHESGHYFLEAFATLADDPRAPEAMKRDMATVREWLGNDGGEFTTEQHEKWARGSEAYFMEGKAPSLDLADAFSRFKSWLVNIYKSLAGLNVKVSPEIKEVMDRMLATDAEIAEARAEQQMRPLFTDAPAGMSKSDFATYQRMAQRSQDQAEQRLIDKAMSKVRREREAWYKDEKKAVRAEVTASMSKQPVYRLTEALSNRRWFGSDDELPDMRMDRQALTDLFGDGILKEIDRSRFGGKYAIYKPDGESPVDVAKYFGFQSASQMVEALQNAPKLKDAIDAEVERVMTERHGDPMNDGTIEEEALRAVHNDQQANTVVAEVRHLAKQTGRKTGNLSARVYRQRAKAMLGRMSVKEAAKPHLFLSAERRAANAAQKAFAKVARGGGEAALAEAYQAKEQQLLNHMLFNESKEFEASLARGREKMRGYDKKSVREKLAGGYIEQIDELLARFDFRKRSPGQVQRQESLKEYVDRMEADGREAELAVDARLMDEARRVHYTRLTVDEFNGLMDTVANIDHMGRFKQKLIEKKRARDLAESAANVEGAIRKSQKASDRRDSSRGMQALNLIRRPDTIMIDLDDGAEMGVVYDELKRGIDEGQAEEQARQVKMAEDFDALFNNHYSRKELRAMVEPKAISGVTKREWSKQEIIALALNMGAEENHQRVLDRNVDPEMQIDPETLHNLLSTLDENDWRFVQGMWDMVNSYWPDLAAVHKRRTGVEPDKVQAKLMYDGAPDFVRGGYYPIKYDATRGKAAARDEQSAWDKFLTAGHGSTAAVKNGMTKQREKTGGGRTIKYDLSVPFQHLRETVRYIALSEAVDNAYRILNHEDVVRAFQDTGNADTHKTLNLWVKDTAQGPIFNTDLLNWAARMVKNNFTLSKLALNLKTVILQATGIGQSAATIGKKNMARGYLAYLKRPGEMIADITEKSPFMAERQSTFQKDIYDFVNDVKIQSPLAGRWARGKRLTAQVGFWPMIKMQFLAVDVPTWIGAYGAGLEKYNGDDAKAVHYADRMVARAQDSGLFGDRSAVERGTVSENVRQADFIRSFTTLGGYMLTKLNRMNVTARQAKLGISESATATEKAAVALSAATDMMLLLAFEPIFMALIYGLMTDDDEPEDVANFIAAEMGMAVVGGIPVVRDMASAARGYGGGGIYGAVLEMPYRAGVQAYQGEFDPALVRAIGDLVGTGTGLPTTFTTRMLMPFVDDDTSPAEMLMGSNPLTR